MRREPDAGMPFDAARLEIRQALMSAFCGVLHATRLPPIAVLELAAEAVGSIYREVADAHLGDRPCPCGWHPSLPADLATLQAALTLIAAPPPGIDLARAEVAGRA
ncbi:hypothetical protein [Bosea sp. 124]|uniref:hypothetical protein n=1 Tax=Bosea sp. 124 TaxID=2135642 RepID=UPI000D36258A|nr:hypothetical protein [Bosea sp. 124]PTM39751.1 hypothetical protein C8D03_1256 [Bosea sp. 124]